MATNNSTNTSNPVAIAEGGHGATTATEGFDNLGPGTTKGDLIAHDGSNNVRFAVGADGEILKANSAQTEGLEWATTPGAGGWVHIATGTASASSSLDFTSGIDSTYNLYCFRIDGLVTSTSNYLRMRTSNDSGSTWDSTASDYYGETWYATSTSAFMGGIATTYVPLVADAAYGPYYGYVYLLNPSNTSFYTQYVSKGYTIDNGTGNTHIFSHGGARQAAEAVNGVRFLPSGGTLTSGTVRLYGLRKT